MQRRCTTLRNQIFAGTALAALMQASAFAQTAPADGGIQEIVVTAERHEQSVQKSPLALQVLGADEITKSGLTQADDLSKLTTGIEVGSAGANAQIYIRGVGSYAQTPLQNPGVAFNVDGVYVGRADSTNGNFYDLARIEVLKGPQGTLYGRNANGGAVNLITNEPQLNVTSVDLNSDIGNYQLLHFGGAVNVPLDDTKALRIALNEVSRNGYLSDGADDDQEQEARVRFKWRVDDDTTLLLNTDYSHLGGAGASYVNSPTRPGSDPYEAAASPAAQIYQHSFNATTAPITVYTVPDDTQNSTYANVSAQLDTRLNFGTLTIVPAYRYSDTFYRNTSGTIYDAKEKTDQKSLEARLGDTTPILTWVAGAYIFNEDVTGYNDINGSPFLLDNRTVLAPTTTAYAAFGQTTVNVFDGFRLIGGLRYTYEQQTDTGSTYDQRFGGYRLIESFPGKANFDGVTYKAGAEYDIAPRSMIYATYSTGFKAGGFNQTVAPESTFQPEKLDALEFGSHNRFFDNKLQLNGTLFNWRYNGLQDSRINFDPLGNINFITFNSGNATIRGGSLDVVGKITNADTVRLSEEYAYSRYDTFGFQTPAAFFQPGSVGCPLTISGGFVHVNCAGFPVDHVPKWSGTFNYNHVFSLEDDSTVTFNGAVKYTAAHYIASDFIDAEKQSSYTTFDAYLSYDPPAGNWSLTLYGKNLTDAVYYQSGVQLPFIGGLVNAAIGAPRTYGLQAAYHF